MAQSLREKLGVEPTPGRFVLKDGAWWWQFDETPMSLDSAPIEIHNDGHVELHEATSSGSSSDNSGSETVSVEVGNVASDRGDCSTDGAAAVEKEKL